jgi:hypothetical protein
MLGDGHADHGPLRHGGVVFVPLEGGRILFDLQSNKIKEATTATEATICARSDICSKDIVLSGAA